MHEDQTKKHVLAEFHNFNHKLNKLGLPTDTANTIQISTY